MLKNSLVPDYISALIYGRLSKCDVTNNLIQSRIKALVGPRHFDSIFL
jgi:hypothetical protein